MMKIIMIMICRDKNPLTRISIEEIITHEWVTMDGDYPINLRTSFTLRLGTLID